MVRCGSKYWLQKAYVLKRDRTMGSKYANHFRLNSHQYDWGWYLYDQLMSTRIFTLSMNKIFLWAPNFMRQMAMGTFWICWSSCTNWDVFCILREKYLNNTCLPYVDTYCHVFATCGRCTLLNFLLLSDSHYRASFVCTRFEALITRWTCHSDEGCMISDDPIVLYLRVVVFCRIEKQCRWKCSTIFSNTYDFK